MPWRFVVCQGEGLDKLSDVFEASKQRGDKESKQEKAKKFTISSAFNHHGAV